MRIGFDIDGVLADFASAFHAVDAGLYPAGPAIPPGHPESTVEQSAAEPDPPGTPDRHETGRRRAAIWQAIRSTPDFWTTLAPIDDGGVRRIQNLMLEHAWDVFFITHRPATEGQTVQRQTQQWLVGQGFELPSVLVIVGARAPAAAALRLDYLVDDSSESCADVKAAVGSGTRPLLVSSEPGGSRLAPRTAGLVVVRSIGQALDALEQVSVAEANPGMWKRLSSMFGWS